MQITGKVIKIEPTQEVSATFSKKLIVVETPEQYAQQLPIEFVNKNIDKLDSITVGQNVKVDINLRGSEYNGKHYLSAQGWKIEVDSSF